MKKQSIVTFAVLCFMLLFVFAMSGCKGSDGAAGANGAPGAPGATGPTGPTGPVTLTDESCMICHTTGQVEDIGAIHTASTNSNLFITVTSVASNATGSVVVNFHIDQVSSTGTGTTPLATLALKNYPSIKIADLIPHATVVGGVQTVTGDNTFSTDYWEMWAAETPGQLAHPACAPGSSLDSTSNTCYSDLNTTTSVGTLATPATGALTNLTGGDYSYTFTTGFGQAWPGYNNAGYSATNTKRVAIELSSPPTGYNKAHPGILDVTFASNPAAGAVTGSNISSVRQYATIQACQKCHGPLMDAAAHANSRNDLRECDFCHSALYGSQPSHAAGFMAVDAADLPVFIHKIHNNSFLDTDDIASAVTESVTYPQPIQNCVTCHSDPAATGADQINNWKTHPTGRVCASCHNTNIVTLGTTTIAATFTHDNTLATKIAVPSGAKNDSQCTGCHGSSGTAGDSTDIVTVHDTSPTGLLATGWDIPEYIVTISMSTPSNNATEVANGFMGYYVSGETITVDVTVAANPAFTGTAGTIPNIYTAPKDSAYVSGGGLSVASLYLYGPRAFALPLTGTQANSLFGKGDATGFHFSTVVPANATAGTYMARVRIADYGYNRNNVLTSGHIYQIESTALKTFQIGANVARKTGKGGWPAHAAPELKVDGAAPCIACHANTTMHTTDHAAPFDTDECTACHDQSGGHADYIGNRVHAVHDASVTGDLSDIDWSEITFPQNITKNNCSICHTVGSTSGSYLVQAYSSPCMGCHNDDPAAAAHMLQMGGK